MKTISTLFKHILFPSILGLGAVLLLLALLQTPGAAAATDSYATYYVARSCSGVPSPCFTTLQAAVDAGYTVPLTVAYQTGALISVQNEYHGDPAFAADGHHITAASAALNRGVATGVFADIDGEARPSGPSSDLGVDELQARVVDTRLVQSGAAFSGDEGWITITVELSASETLSVTGFNDAFCLNDAFRQHVIDVQFRNQRFISPSYQPTEDYGTSGLTWGRVRYIYNFVSDALVGLPKNVWTKAVDVVIHFHQSNQVGAVDWTPLLPSYQVTDEYNNSVFGIEAPIPPDLQNIVLGEQSLSPRIYIVFLRK